jgi:hypothetical protein
VVAVRFVIVDDGKEFRSGGVTPQESHDLRLAGAETIE